VRFENVEEGVTVARQVDEVTGLSTLVVIDAKRRGSLTKTMRPQVKLLNDEARSQDRRHRTRCSDRLPGWRADHGERRSAVSRG
jgi:hypothetical protein